MDRARILDKLAREREASFNDILELGIPYMHVAEILDQLQAENVIHVAGHEIRLVDTTDVVSYLLPSIAEIHRSPGIHDLDNLWTFSSLSVLVISPFFQGMWYGLGEAIGKIYVGNYFGLDPVLVFSGRARTTMKP